MQGKGEYFAWKDVLIKPKLDSNQVKTNYGTIVETLKKE